MILPKLMELRVHLFGSRMEAELREGKAAMKHNKMQNKLKAQNTVEEK